MVLKVLGVTYLALLCGRLGSLGGGVGCCPMGLWRPLAVRIYHGLHQHILPGKVYIPMIHARTLPTREQKCTTKASQIEAVLARPFPQTRVVLFDML